ncbi:KpsF/GutQ family sugar-phosphate isomerase [Quatrionicoccus australiensis]|uniref:KpsF/GutQ family sugar-phosphate isomerase n=1 Tax=Quatrionicoccus australiensis TaxID=138118 RepID=UPI001CFB173A|nr:KpsF/GutQ family sugar-phosphate isomerase [Quatrionicoccus australiensis]MCB4360756.1 KpsF/GutQ family sugar-phosphate isomerase [Quatrionicoccus australiensis]
MNPSQTASRFSPERALELGRQTLSIEAAAVDALKNRINDDFAKAVELILASKGRLIVSGMGKSGHIARKIAATMASTGTPAYFVHPGEASHGDLGMITREDVLLALSNSGESEELLRIVPLVKRSGARLISMTGVPTSTLAREADIHLDAGVAQEACPHNLAPTASTTAALALGDALAVALLDARGFSPEDFARSHPGGSLGRRLLTHVRDVMRAGEQVPSVGPETGITDAIIAMSRGGLGLVVITDTAGKALGIFTDGDLRRAFEKRLDLQQGNIASVMHPAPRSIGPDRLAVEAVEMMERLRINALLVVDTDGCLVGALNMHDLFTAKVI